MSAPAAVRRFKPLLDRVLVQTFKPETKTAGGIYLPEMAKQSIHQAKVRIRLNLPPSTGQAEHSSGEGRDNNIGKG
jgi:co-chaperonin GroES (HSP10)